MTLRYTPERFDAMFAADDDPWRFRSRWYEARKRALTMACLPAPHYGSVFEPGCANGELSVLLADRCNRLLASDGTARAVALARARLAALPHVRVEQAWMPAQWPAGRFDLVVLSELGYFLDADDLDRLGRCVAASLAPGGTVLACHWRWPIAGCVLTGDAVHERLAATLALPRLGQLLEDDLRIEVWCADGRSVGTREGLTPPAEAGVSDKHAPA